MTAFDSGTPSVARSGEPSGPPWAELPEQVADYLAGSLPGTVDEIVAAMGAEIPAYGQVLEGPFREALTRSAQLVLDQFVALVRDGYSGLGARRGLFRAFGREEARQGRSLEALLAAYRVGARLAWRRTREAAQRAGLDAETMSLLAETTFAYIDELSALSAEGYAEEQSARAGELERRRGVLVRLLTATVAPDPRALQEAAVAARWALPATVGALVWDFTDQDGPGPRLPRGALLAEVDGLGCALVPDPRGPGRRAEIEAALRRGFAVLGPTVSPPDSARSFRRAADTYALVLRGLLPGEGLVLAEEHLADVLMHGHPDLLTDIRRRALAPFAELGDKARIRQADTLLAWLEHHGRVPDIAEALHVHPQTVRYRLAQLRELFGESLDDPRTRFELLLSLRRTGAEP